MNRLAAERVSRLRGHINNGLKSVGSGEQNFLEPRA